MLDIVTIVVATCSLTVLALFMPRPRLGVQMRAAAEDFRMARLCGVRGDLVIATAFAIGGLLAGVGAVLLVGQTGSISSAWA